MPSFMTTEPLPLLKNLQRDLDEILAKLKEQGVSQSGYAKAELDIRTLFSTLTQVLSKTEGPSSTVNISGLPQGQFGRRRRRKTRRYYK